MKHPSAETEGKFLWVPFVAFLPLVFVGIGIAFFGFRNSVAAAACMLLAAAGRLYVHWSLGYSVVGLFQAKYKRGGDYSALFWFDVVISLFVALGSSYALLYFLAQAAA